MKPTKARYSNDRKAPRMRKAQFSKQIITKELWKKFSKEYPEYKLTWQEFQATWMDIAQVIRTEIVENPLGVKLGSYTGELKYQYISANPKYVNHDTSNELGQDIPHLNIVTKGKVGKVKWERRWAVKFNKVLQFWAFDPFRDIHTLAKNHTDANPDSIRVSRGTHGGEHIWDKLKKAFKNQQS